MTFFRRAAGSPSTLGVLAGTFNPPTRAHLALAAATLGIADEVVFVLPRVFPHKEYTGASFEDRVRMLDLATAGQPRYSIAFTDAGLFIDVAHACRRAYGAGVRILFPCGSDAADRIVNWDYGRAGAIAGQLEEFEMLVADRQSRFTPPPELAARIHVLHVDPAVRSVSSTEVRERIRRGEPWRHLVPETIAAVVEECYRAIP
jgi:nicotinate-nucleotide adenylyltransferase